MIRGLAIVRTEVNATRRDDNWMQTVAGRQFWPTDPTPDEIYIDDIAGALSKLCRYGGHCLKFYSVAEHCVHVARAAGPRLALTALMHDASEAYLVDVPRPVKRDLTNYAEIEDGIMRAVAQRFDVAWPLPDEVKVLDNAILADERAAIMATPPRPWTDNGGPLGVRIECWDPDRAEYEFMRAFRMYGGRP